MKPGFETWDCPKCSLVNNYNHADLTGVNGPFLVYSFSILNFLCMQRAGNHTNLSLGKALLKARGLFPQSYWYWIGVGALLGYTVLFNIHFTIFLTYLNRKPSRFE